MKTVGVKFQKKSDGAAATQRHVAELAGVSQQAVSLFFKAPEKLADPTLEKIRKAMRSCGYRPNSAARAMRSRHFDRIACVFFTDSAIGIYNPSIATYAGEAALAAGEGGFSMIYEPFPLKKDGQGELAYPKIFAELAVDGILAIDVAGWIPAELEQALGRMEGPTVWLNRTGVKGATVVRIDDLHGARELARHVVGTRPERTAYFGLDADHYSARERLLGVRGVLQAALPAGGYAEFLVGRGKQCIPLAERLVAESSWPVSVICYNRVFRDLVLERAAAAGVRIGKDITLYHFASDWETPREEYAQVTAWDLPEKQVAAVGVARLLDEIAGRSRPGGEIKVAGSLHIGGSGLQFVKEARR